ncbi:MAG TPA: thiamine biosynthesis protein ThiS, partial [Alphaproteobacteria bacterium]|nr:thiamine biosynthesis protein ThiS [Alphaproteobacteria bacterium]HBF97327.1 thiamine biosynthesis protein ThiS [Alphaproteobacteria bacterium]
MSVDHLLRSLRLDPRKIAVERNLEIVPRSEFDTIQVKDGDRLEIVHFIGGGEDAVRTAPVDNPLTIAGRTFNSRLIIGTGKYADYAVNAAAAEAAEVEMITVAVRRVNLSDPDQPMLIDYIDPKKYTYL